MFRKLPELDKKIKEMDLLLNKKQASS